MYATLNIIIAITLVLPSLSTQTYSEFTALTRNERLPPYTCIEDSRGWCRFSSIKLLKSKYRFQPFAERPDEDIRKVSFDDSTIPVFASDVCDTFSNVEELWLERLEMYEVANDAFQSCAKLRWLRLDNSYITNLPGDVFKHNQHLRILYIEDNQIRRVNEQWFVGLTELEELYFSVTQIDYFPLNALQDAANLKKLVLHSNNLIDLDEMLIVKQFPKLREIFYNKNEISCRRMTAINAALNSTGVKPMPETWGPVRLRPYNTSAVDGIDCLDEDTWATMLRDKLVGFFEQPVTTRQAVAARITLPPNSREEDEQCQRKYKTLNLKARRMQSLILEQQEFIQSLLIADQL